MNADIQARLWREFKAGDADALGRLAEVHYRALYNYATRFSHDPDFIRDAIQELYLDLWERRNFLSETAFVKSYLLKALRHKMIKESARLRRFHEPHEAAFDTESNDLPIESLMIESEHVQFQHERLEQIITNLSKRQQEIIYLRFYQNLNHEEIAAVMALGKQSVSNLLYRTLKEIRDVWAPAEFCWTMLLCFMQ
ncbi:sigma-70 family RNA polymerase sigma factor [Dyadobacter sandarakinus]|uniref:Sigma-70 family RNA polymerase sigma factor n=2 Tax=Dyadobacter sandarakinus TaxID=2747268 RepID=A0ABX7ID66_9BACT|nr:sigma-70 family RNA polymerase sigma factor [Dyadobacter sandarakinus]